MRRRTGAGLRPAMIAMAVACAAASIAPGCKGSWKAAKGAAGGPGGPGSHILIESGAPDRDCIYDVIVEEMDDSQMADEVFGRLGNDRFEVPAIMVSLDDARAATELLEAIEDAGCNMGTARVVNGKVEWKLEVVEQGNGSECMVNALRDIFPGTSSADWGGKVGIGQVLRTSTDSSGIETLRTSLEKKCGCRIRKTYAVK